jgi:DNA (cytosine-5)-methyltransferase 1
MRPGEICVDLFAGGGGFSEGFSWATGVPPAVAVNHDEDAIVMHTANHPETEHHHEDIFEVDPIEATRGRAVGWLHLSPDCTHFSRAKGGKPRSQKIRGLAWVAVAWAKAVSPRIVSLENVAEFLTWGPLDEHGQPIKAHAGETFREFVGQLEQLAYAVEWRILNAADYGAPTSRKRLFLIARRDGQPIRWPKPTHGPKGSQPYRTAAECIDWSIPVPSIFDRKKPLAEATQRRIAEGIRRYVLEAKRPFLVNLTHGGRVESIDEPFKTVTGAHRGEKAVVAPTLIQVGYGEREGQAPRVLNLEAPLGTIVGQGNKHALVAAFLAKHHGSRERWDAAIGQSPNEPLHTIISHDNKSVVAASLTKFYGTNKDGAPIDDSMPTITASAGGGHLGVVAASLCKYYGSDEHGQALDEPMHTIPTVDRFGLVAAFLTKFRKDSIGSPMDNPMPTITSGASSVRPAGAAHALGIVTVTIDGEEFVIADIGMRMLQPRELARAQGFPDRYILTGTKSQQVARIGNSVCPQVAAAIVTANLDEEAEVAA